MESTRGKLLIASGRLGDPNFFRSVVLMVQHSEEGALGLILNRPLEATVKEACQEFLEEPCENEDSLFRGGPCEGPLMVVHREESAKDQDILPGVYFTTERYKIASLLRGPSHDVRFFVGYAGWAAGQLESEMESDSWIVCPADAAHIFQSNETLWAKLMVQQSLGEQIDTDNIPDDPTVN